MNTWRNNGGTSLHEVVGDGNLTPESGGHLMHESPVQALATTGNGAR
jgi:hypothetical protein